MSLTLQQIFALNPTNTIGNNDLFYLVQPPYTPGTDAAILGSDLKAIFGSGTVNPGLANQVAYYAANGTTVSGLPTLSNGVLATNALGVPSINQQLLPFIVGPTGFYTTIQSAINAAAVGASATHHNVVLINSGTYVENLTLESFVDLASFAGISESSVIISGNAIYNPVNPNETFTASGIAFRTTGGGAALSVNGANTCTMDFNDCKFIGDGGTAFENTNANATITKSACHLTAGAGQKICNITGGAINSIDCKVNATDTASTISGSANVVISGAFDSNAFVLAGTCQLSVVNSTCLPPANLSFIDIGVGCLGIIFSNTIVCNAPSGFWAIGAGSIAANSITTLAGSATSINTGTLTYIAEPLLVGNLSFDGGNSFIDTDGQLIIGQTGGSPLLATLTAGAGIGISNGPGSITISNTGGTLTSISAGTGITLTPDPIVATGTIALTTPVSLANGGTNAGLVANNGGIVWSNATQLQILAGTGTARQMLQSGATATPDWSTSTWPATTTANQILYSSAGNTVGEITTAANGLLVTSNLSVPSILAGPGTTGNILRSNAALAPSFSTATFASTYGASELLYSNGANSVQGLATAASSVLVTSAGSVPSWSATLPAFTTSSITFSPTTGGIVGTTTNDNADAGKVGEFVSSVILSSSPVSFSNNTAQNITTVSLTAGDWDVRGNIFVVSVTGTCTAVTAWLSSTSATLPDGVFRGEVAPATGTIGSGTAIDTPSLRFSLSGTTTIYLSALTLFSSGAVTICGAIYARRMR